MSHIQAPKNFVEDYYSADLLERGSKESKWFLSRLNAVSGENVLSFGCGPNLLDDAQFFANLPKRLTGIDINENNIEFLKGSTYPELTKCKERLQKNETTIELRVGSITDQVPEWEGGFDSVYAMGVLGMLTKDDFTKTIGLIYRYLKPGGTFLDIDWTDCRLSKEKYAERESYNWYSRQGPSVEDMVTIIADAGLSIKTNETYDVDDPDEYGWGKIYSISAVR